MLTLDNIRELQEEQKYYKTGESPQHVASTIDDTTEKKDSTLIDAERECQKYLMENMYRNGLILEDDTLKFAEELEHPKNTTHYTNDFVFGKLNKKYRIAIDISYEDRERGGQDDFISFGYALERCQEYIAKNFRERRDERDKAEQTKEYIKDFVYKAMQGGVRKTSGRRYTHKELVNDLTNEIMNYGPITRYVEDDSIDEIRANGPKEIFLESGGKTRQSKASFRDIEHMERIISKLIGVSKVRLTPKTPMVNARTMEGYRVNATYSGISPYNQPAFVLRKFSKREIEPEDMLKNKSFSKGMYALLALIPKADLSWVTVGPTGSGKTTLNGLLVKEIDPLSRVITIENPSEMRLRRMENGIVINDVLQYECVPDDEGTTSADPTMENLLINAMRQSPHWIGPGELRTPGEFATALRAAQTGHYFFTTLHAEGDNDAITRFLTSYLMVSNEPAELALRNICSAVRFIIFQEKLADGTRKVTSISEVIGSEGLKPITNQIYKFDIEDVREEAGTHRVLEIVGTHRRVGKLSEDIQERMLKSGIRRERFEYLTKEPNNAESEEYD
ncbi:MAG: Flp pilus assembly complex ATPase component TadA [Defluviitaleaceae bacterium]|nr:Flp pilus assembly complex ATPase component TadA [Defluviitaleaceae bacterium]